jgi:hypothetical protein
MNVPDMLKAAAQALSDRAELEHAPALAGLLQNRADDMERNIVVWQRTGQDVPALVEKYYGAGGQDSSPPSARKRSRANTRSLCAQDQRASACLAL